MKSKYWLSINYNYDEDANNDFLEEKGIKDYNQDVYEFYFENKNDGSDNFYKLLTEKEYKEFLTTKDLEDFMFRNFEETIPYRIYDNVRGLEIKKISYKSSEV